jgi:hypothetical protein
MILLAWIPALLLWGVTIFLMHRLSAFRADRPWHQGYFGPIIDSLSGFEWMRRRNYTDAGHQWHRRTIAVWVGAIAASFLAGLVTLVGF